MLLLYYLLFLNLLLLVLLSVHLLLQPYSVAPHLEKLLKLLLRLLQSLGFLVFIKEGSQLEGGIVRGAEDGRFVAFIDETFALGGETIVIVVGGTWGGEV